MEDMTLDELARIVAEGFAELRAEMREGFASLRGEIKVTNERIDATNHRIDTIVVPVLDDHSRRIKDLEVAAG